MVTLPLELARHVAEFCPVPALRSLVLLNRYCYRTIIPHIYNGIELLSATQVMKFTYTMIAGRKSLRLYPRYLVIKVPDDFIVTEGYSTSAVAIRLRNALILLRNITELVLDIAPNILSPLFCFGCLEFAPFKLKSFSSRPINYVGFQTFLSRQTAIEELVVIDPIMDDDSTGVIMHITPDLIPKLRSLTSGKQHLLNLVPRRPVESITLTDPASISHIPSVASALALASTPLVQLNVSIWVRRVADCEGYLAKWLSSLSHCHGSLETIVFRISLTKSFMAPTAPSGSFLVTLDRDKFKGLLGHFVSLQTFTLSLERNPDVFQRLQFHVPELSQLASWREICPSLNSVSLFGDVLSAT